MKKSLLFAGLLAMGLAVNAQNPFAYNASTGEIDGTDVPVNYTLNADAERVVVDFIDATGAVAKSVELDADFLTKGEHNAMVSLEDLDGGNEYTLAIRVKGADIDAPAQVGPVYTFWSPYGIAIDNNPLSTNFGRILVTECQPNVNAKNATTAYWTSNQHSGVGAGIYAFDPQMNRIQNQDGTYGFVTPGIQESYSYADYVAEGATSPATMSLKKIRITNDGRIFVGGVDVKNGQPLWEVNPDNLADWTPFFVGEKSKFEETGYDCNLYDADGNFVAGYSAAFDVMGEGDNLKLVNLSATRGQVFTYGNYKTFEYPIGSATSWDAAADEMDEVIPLSQQYTISIQNVTVAYDPNGNIWYGQYRGAPTEAEPSIKHASKNADGEWEEDFSIVANDNYTFNRGGGISCSPDGSMVAFSSGNFNCTIYDVEYDEFGAPTLTEKYVINSSNNSQVRGFNDIAWDVAGNLYGCDNGKETFTCFQLPRKAATAAGAPKRINSTTTEDPLEVRTPLRAEYNVIVPDTSTGVRNISSKTVTSVEYINMNGQVSNVPFKGVNVVVTNYADGTKSTAKIVK
ncbi:MAG: hypothetical protein J6I72_03005 [Muribaculaceae bacterium]|nr:hypothetical protein [Muribaculaceae bacterium]